MSSPFTIKGLPDDQDTPLDLWQPIDVASPSDIAFTVDAADEPEIVWSVDLPDDVVEANHLLQHQTDLLHQTQQANATAQQTLTNLPDYWLTQEVSFSALQQDDSPEGTLRRNLTYLQTDQAGFPFSADEENSWLDTTDRFKAFINQTSQLLHPTLKTETIIGGRYIAFTTVGLTGDLSTIWHGHRLVLYQTLHQRAVQLTIKSRLALFQLLGQIATGATALIAKFNMPGGQLWALPAAWQYIKDICAQTRNLMAQQQALHNIHT